MGIQKHNISNADAAIDGKINNKFSCVLMIDIRTFRISYCSICYAIIICDDDDDDDDNYDIFIKMLYLGYYLNFRITTSHAT